MAGMATNHEEELAKASKEYHALQDAKHGKQRQLLEGLVDWVIGSLSELERKFNDRIATAIHEHGMAVDDPGRWWSNRRSGWRE